MNFKFSYEEFYEKYKNMLALLKLGTEKIKKYEQRISELMNENQNLKITEHFEHRFLYLV